jgi:beta-glucosidase
MMWEIVPDGLADAARRVAATGVPVIVTEHGFADAEDRFRSRALVDALTGLGRVIAGGTPVLGYMHWSLMDNFEWAEGFGPRFGLYRVDALTDPAGRERRRSAEVYARIIKANAITPELTRDLAAMD